MPWKWELSYNLGLAQKIGNSSLKHGTARDQWKDKEARLNVIKTSKQLYVSEVTV
jgi:hypothetical protein